MPQVATHAPAPTQAAMQYAQFMTVCDAQAAILSDGIGEPVDALELQAAWIIVSGDIDANAPAYDCLDALAYGAAFEGLI